VRRDDTRGVSEAASDRAALFFAAAAGEEKKKRTNSFKNAAVIQKRVLDFW
jgi:hypothetical protein